MDASEKKVLREVSSRIDTIEKLAREMATLGAEVPAIAKNAQVLLATTYAMRFGVSDLVEPEDRT